MRVYLCGPIAGCSDAECKDWREAAKKALPDTRDPMDRDYRVTAPDDPAEIVEPDKRDIDECDALLVYFPRPSVGTAMEIIYAWERNKRVVVVDVSGKPLSAWVRYHAEAVFTELAPAIEYLRVNADRPPWPGRGPGA